MQQSWVDRNLSKLIVIPLIVIFAGASIWLTWDTYSFENASRTAEGEVIELIPNKRRSVTYSPLIRFKTAEGKVIEFEGLHRSNPPIYDIGERVQVRYLPGDPESARTASWEWLMPSILWGITIAITAGAMLMGAFKRTEPFEIHHHL
ncbi:MAG: DUF3592 domain-containing protein [Bacteroidota bacterium]